jgi:hypothetical protein
MKVVDKDLATRTFLASRQGLCSNERLKLEDIGERGGVFLVEKLG